MDMPLVKSRSTVSYQNSDVQHFASSARSTSPGPGFLYCSLVLGEISTRLELRSFKSFRNSKLPPIDIRAPFREDDEGSLALKSKTDLS